MEENNRRERAIRWTRVTVKLRMETKTLTVEDWCNRQIENGEGDPYGGGLVQPSASACSTAVQSARLREERFGQKEETEFRTRRR